MIRESSTRQVKSVRTAFDIVGVLQNYDGVGLDELHQRVDLAKSTVHNYLATLESMGYVVERDGAYYLGLRFLTHGMAAKSRLEVRDAAAAALSALSASVGHPAWLITAEHGRGLFVERAVPDGDAAVYGRIGKRSYLHTHAPGKAILAALPEASAERILEYHGLPSHTERTITDRAALETELSEIRERGYATGDGEAALGVRSAGVAFESPDGRYHAVGVFAYSHELGVPPDSGVVEALNSAVSEIRAPGRGGSEADRSGTEAETQTEAERREDPETEAT